MPSAVLSLTGYIAGADLFQQNGICRVLADLLLPCGEFDPRSTPAFRQNQNGELRNPEEERIVCFRRR